jgi:hypothetical protein
MIRRLFTLLSAVSLMLCVATCVLWWRTDTATTWESLTWESSGNAPGVQPPSPRIAVHSWGGVLSAHAYAAPLDEAGPGFQRGMVTHRRGPGAVDVWFVFESIGFEVVPPREGWHVRTQHQTVVAASGILPLAWAAGASLRYRRRQRRVHRATAGLCPACGYDLRASPDRCPECGAVPGAKGASA